MTDRLLTVAEIARESGCSRKTAWRWIDEIRRSDAASVQRRGRKILVIASALGRRLTRNVGREIETLKSEVVRLKDEAKLQNARIDGLYNELHAFRRTSNAWLTRGRP